VLDQSVEIVSSLPFMLTVSSFMLDMGLFTKDLADNFHYIDNTRETAIDACRKIVEGILANQECVRRGRQTRALTRIANTDIRLLTRRRPATPHIGRHRLDQVVVVVVIRWNDWSP
jgi:hypothetical protein